MIKSMLKLSIFILVLDIMKIEKMLDIMKIGKMIALGRNLEFCMIGMKNPRFGS